MLQYGKIIIGAKTLTNLRRQEKMENKQIQLINQAIALEKAQFVRLQQIKSKASAVIKDEILDFNFQIPYLSFIFRRSLKIQPESFFEVSVEFSYRAEISQNSIEELEKNGNLTKEFFGRQLEKIAENTNMIAVASNIISNLTSINGNHPVVTPPLFVK